MEKSIFLWEYSSNHCESFTVYAVSVALQTSRKNQGVRGSASRPPPIYVEKKKNYFKFDIIKRLDEKDTSTLRYISIMYSFHIHRIPDVINGY
jgi:hypothetical protein